MKKVFATLLCLVAFILPVCGTLAVQALAVELSDFEYYTEYGTYAIHYDGYYHAVAAEKIAASGVALNADDYWVYTDTGYYFDNAAFEADYATALAAMEQSAESENTDAPVSEPLADDTASDEVQEPIESEGAVDGSTDTPVPAQPTYDTASDDKYPVGSYIDEMGNVYSPEGELLSSGGEAPSYFDALGLVLDEDMDVSDGVMVSDEEPEPHVYDIIDLRSGGTAVLASDDAADGIVSSLKSLIVSIFGEYEPVYTSTAVTETVDNVTTTTLIDTVAEGAAGVDYEWLSGVLLFGILLFCLMKLLGGILK